MRARNKQGSVVLDRRIKCWNFFWWEHGKRHSKKIGTKTDYPTKAAAWRAAKPLRDAVETQKPIKTGDTAPTVSTLIEQYRQEKMPARSSTRRGYDAWLDNHIVPRWGTCAITELQARPVELWLESLDLSPKSKLHIRGMLSILWDYAQWRGDIATQRNPMELVAVKDATKRTRQPRSLTVEQFHALLSQFDHDACLRTMLLLAVGFGLRISELLGLRWSDVDWLNKTICIQRGVVKQVIDAVKTKCSARTMVCDDEVIEVLKTWKQTSQFSAPDDWMFASPTKLGRQPLSYTRVWYALDEAAIKAEIGHISSHSFRHTYRSWLDSVGTSVGVQQRLMRHADIRTTMNIYGDATTADMREAHQKVIRLVLPQA